MAENRDFAAGLRALRGLQQAVSDSLPDTSEPPRSIDAAVVTDQGSVGPSTFISWAHADPGWSEKRTSAWQALVAQFALTLPSLGIDCDVDLFHQDETTDWTRFGPQAIVGSSHTLIVMSKAWADRWSGNNAPSVGAGAAAEADTLRGLFSANQATWQSRVIIVMLPGVEASVIPPDLQRVARFTIDPANLDSYDGLIRTLTGQPTYVKPPVLSPPIFKGVSNATDHLAVLQAKLADVHDAEENLQGASAAGSDKTERKRLQLTEASLRGFIEALLNDPR